MCDWCQKKGHTKEHCWKIIGYPNDGQERRKVNNVAGESSYKKQGDMENRLAVDHGGSALFSEEQYKKILAFLNKEDSNTNTAQQTQQYNDHQANLTGFLKCQGQGDW